MNGLEREKSRRILIITLFLLVITVPGIHAQVPMRMNYQGYLTDAGGAPVNDTVSITFSLYAVPSGGSALWWETHSVTVTVGVYNVVLGDTTPLSPSHFADPLYLGVQVGTDDEMAPRQRITSVAFAINAARLDGQDASAFLTTETDPTVPSSIKDGITWSEVSSRPAGLDDGDDMGITTESDPTVPSSVKDGITWSEVSSRPAGLDDGDDVGITSEDDPQVGSISTNRVPKWNGSSLTTGSLYDYNGSIGIGTSPGERLHIREKNSNYGAAVLLDSTGGTDGRSFWVGSTLSSNAGGTGLFQIYDVTASRPRLNIESGGYVGIGTSDPQSLLHVSAGTDGKATLTLEADTDNNDEYDQPLIYFLQDGGLVAGQVGYLGGTNGLQISSLNDSGSTHIDFCTFDGNLESLEHMRFTSTGRFGIGTTNPEEKVHITEKSDTFGAAILLDSTDSTDGRKFYVGSTLSGNAGGAGLFQIYDATPGTNATRLNIDFEGDVGIGTTAPEAKLHVVTYSRDGIHSESSAEWRSGVYGVSTHTNGYGLFGRNSNNNTRGYIGGEYGIWARAESGAYAAFFEGKARCEILEIEGADLSEQYPVQGAETGIAPSPGMVVSIDPRTPGKLIVSHTAYDRKVAGIISGAGDIDMGLVMGQEDTTDKTKKPVALTGRVYCHADTSNGPIEPGDLLTTSDIPGHAMRVSDYTKAQGAILGKAMSFLEKGQGLVLVLVSLQ